MSGNEVPPPPRPSDNTSGEPRPEAHAAQGRLHSEWMKEFHKQEHAPFEVGKDGKYTVEPGDTVWTIARRALEHVHHNDPKFHPSNKEVLAEQKRIIAANHLRHPGHIEPGEKLTIPTVTEAPHAKDPRPKHQTPTKDPDAPITPPKPGETRGSEWI